MKHKQKYPPISEEIIKQAMQGERYAMQIVLHRYRSYIYKLSGGKVEVISHLNSRLSAAILRFDPDYPLQ